MRIEEIEKGQQEIQEKFSQVTKLVINLTKRKMITDDPSLQGRPTLRKDGIDPSIVPNPNNPCEQEKLRKNSLRQLKHINVQQRCNLLDKKLKMIEGMNDLNSMDPRELCLIPDLVRPSKFKMSKFEKYDGTKCPENHLATYCHKMAGHAHNEDLLIHVFCDSLTGTAAQWYVKLKNEQIRTWRDLTQAFLGRHKYMLEIAQTG